MKRLVIVFIFEFFVAMLSAEAASVCGHSALIHDFSKRAGLKPYEISLLRIDRDLDGTGPDEWILANEESCGSRGCDYQIYRLEGECFSQIGEFSGRFQILEQKVNGYRNLEITQKDGHLSSPIKKHLQYSKQFGKYLEYNE